MKSKKKFLITGGAGFIGFHLAKKLSSLGHYIDIIDNFSRGKYDKEFKDFINKKNISFYKSDLNLTTPKLSNNYSYIFHLAAIVGVKNVLNEPYKVLIDNVESLKKMIEVGRKQKKLERFIFTSTSEVYAGSLYDNMLKFPTKEDSVLTLGNYMNDRNSYMLSKIYGENMCGLSTLPYLIVRPHNIFGERMGMSHVIPEIIKRAKHTKNKKFVVYNPNHKRTFCYIKDAVNMILELTMSKKSLNKIYNIGDQQNELKIIDLTKKILKLMKKNYLIKKVNIKNFSPLKRIPSTRKLKNVINYSIQSSLDANLKKTIDWYLSKI